MVFLQQERPIRLEIMNTAGFRSVLHIWSSKRNLQPNVIQHVGIHNYNDKITASNNAAVDSSDIHAHVKRKYLSGRGIHWALSTKKYRETLLEFEELLEKQYISFVSWKNTQAVQIILSSCILVSINISSESPDIDRIFIDKSLCKKIPGIVSDAVLEENFMLFTLYEKLQVVLVNFSTKSYTNEWRDGDRISSLEPKYSFIDLPGPTGFRVKRGIICNKPMDLVCIWWAFSNEEALSWSPSARDINRCNVIWLSLTGISSVYTLEVMSQMRTDGDLLDAVFCQHNTNHLLTIEQLQSSRTKYLIESCTYAFVGKKIVKTDRTTIATKADVIYQSRNFMQDRIILLCRNSSLVLWDEYNRTSKTTKPEIVPCQATWHPNDIIFLLSNKNGDIQVYDIALNCLSIQLLSDKIDTSGYLLLSQYFFSQPCLHIVCWGQDSGIGPAPDTISCCDDVMLVFDKGPICLLRLQLGICSRGKLSAIELVCEYIKYDQVKEAVNLLSALHWNSSGYHCFQCLVLIVDYILKLPFNPLREECLESTLGAFYAPTLPLLEDVIIQYRDDISRIARRFFHHLLKHKRFKKAFLLAVDIGDKDLFMDIHYYALDNGDDDLANAAHKRAFDIHNKEIIDNELVPETAFEDELNKVYPNFAQMSIDPVAKLEPLHPLQTLASVPHSYEPEEFEFDSGDERKEDTGSWSMSRSNKSPQLDNLSLSSHVSRKIPNTYVDSFGNV